MPLFLPPVRVNQVELDVEGYRIITVQITTEKFWNLELISNVVIFYPSCKVVGTFETVGKILKFNKSNFFPSSLVQRRSQACLFNRKNHLFDKVIECTDDYLTNLGCKLLIAAVIITIYYLHEVPETEK